MEKHILVQFHLLGTNCSDLVIYQHYSTVLPCPALWAKSLL